MNRRGRKKNERKGRKERKKINTGKEIKGWKSRRATKERKKETMDRWIHRRKK